jgi:hypothetical protein
MSEATRHDPRVDHGVGTRPNGTYEDLGGYSDDCAYCLKVYEDYLLGGRE